MKKGEECLAGWGMVKVWSSVLMVGWLVKMLVDTL